MPLSADPAVPILPKIQGNLPGFKIQGNLPGFMVEAEHPVVKDSLQEDKLMKQQSTN